MERIPVKPRVTCPVYYKVTYDRTKRAERTSFINSKPGRQIGKKCQSGRKGTLLFEIKIKKLETYYYYCIYYSRYFRENLLLEEIAIYIRPVLPNLYILSQFISRH